MEHAIFFVALLATALGASRSEQAYPEFKVLSMEDSAAA